MHDPLILLAIGLIVVLGCILGLKLNPFLALLAGGLIVGTLTPTGSLEAFALSTGMSEPAAVAFAGESVGSRFAKAFGETCGKIGLLIAMASIIGVCLLESGAAERIVRTALKWTGDKFAGLGFLVSGFLLSIPIFFDTVFYLMIPLAKSAANRTKRNYVLLVLAIIAGGAMAHSLVPPTPGPLFVALELGVDLGAMIVGGMVVGLFTSGAGFLYAMWANKRWPTPVRSTPDISVEELDALALREESALPSLGFSILPIVLPLALIAAGTLITAKGIDATGMAGTLLALGDKNIALVLSAAVALILMTIMLRRSGKSKSVGPAIQKALLSAGLIILITSAGGAFGAILKQTGIALRVDALATQYNIGLLPLAFLVTMIMRTAQGSATVAMVTSIGIVGGLADANLGYHPVYLALAIGCGSKPIHWMNDSAFWIIKGMTGWSEMETLKLSSATISLMGFVGLPVVMTLAWLFPFA
jgi:GntP family gluconate:H+ symporter